MRPGRNGTYSEGTGPTVDHTLATEDGHFLYAEASQGKPNHMAILQSPIFNISAYGAHCKISFYYHMVGQNIGKLSLLINSSATDYEFEEIWAKIPEVDIAEKHYDVWRHAQHSLAK